MSGISMFDLKSPEATRRPSRLVERENERKKVRQRDQERMLPVVEALARRRGPEGITAADVIAEGITCGIFTGAESQVAQRALSWVGPWLAALARRGVLVALTRAGMHVTRRSEREASHGNAHRVYVAPEFAEVDHG